MNVQRQIFFYIFFLPTLPIAIEVSWDKPSHSKQVLQNVIGLSFKKVTVMFKVIIN